MAGAARADLFIGRVRREAAGIAYCGDMDAVAELPELALGTPETAKPEHRLLEACRIRRLETFAIDIVGAGSRKRRGAAGQCFGCAGKSSGLAHEQHEFSPGSVTSAGRPNRLRGRCPLYRSLRSRRQPCYRAAC